MVIRHVVPADAGAWERMREALWEGDPHGDHISDYFAGTAVGPDAVLLAVDPVDGPVGLVELSIRRDLPGVEGLATGYIEGLFVEPDRRGTDLTRRLLRAAQDWAREQGCVRFASDRDDRVIFDPTYRLRTSATRPTCE